MTFCRWNPKKVGFHLSFDILKWQLVQICIHQTITAGGEVFYTYLIFWRDSREKGVYGKVGQAKNLAFSTKNLIPNFVLPLFIVYFKLDYCGVKIAPSDEISHYTQATGNFFSSDS